MLCFQLEVFMDVISEYGSQQITPEDAMYISAAKTGEHSHELTFVAL